MAEIHTDIDRMIMQAQYLLAMNQSPVDTDMTDMERKQYLDQIKELVQTVQTLLDANIALGNKQKELQAEADRKIAGLQDQVDKQLLENCKPVGVRCMARTMRSKLVTSR